jgi:MFS family permease
MLALQNAALNVCIPLAARDFGVGIADVSLIVLTYLLTIGATLITAGRLGDVFGSKRVFQLGIGVYLAGSALAGFAPNLPILLVLRVAQGVGASCLISNEIALAARAASPSRRGQAVGIIWMLANFGQLAGPLLGGLLGDTIGWRAVFWANTPIAVALLLLGHRFIAPDPQAETRPSLDLAGALLFAGAMVALLGALNRAPIWGFVAPLTVGLVLAAVGLTAALVWHENRAASPMLDLRLFRNPVFAAAIGGALANYLAFQGLLFLAPFALIDLHGLSAAQAGAVLAPMALTTVVVAYVAGWLADRVGALILETVGLICLCVAPIGLAFVGSVSALEMGPYLILAGLGTSLVSVPNANATIAAVPRTQIGLVGGIIHAVRYVGLLGGVALTGAIVSVADRSDGGASGYSASYVALAAVAVCGLMITLARGRMMRRSSV